VAWLECDAAPPYVENGLRYALGRSHGAVIDFTDAASRCDGTVAFLACGELMGEPMVDGRAVATGFGVLGGRAEWQSETSDAQGGQVLDKHEGRDPEATPGRCHAVSDADDARTPARMPRPNVGTSSGTGRGPRTASAIENEIENETENEEGAHE